MDIICWSDLQCPYCYTGEKNLFHALEEMNLLNDTRIDWKSYEIHEPESGNGTVTMMEMFGGKHDMSPEEAREAIDEINKMAKDEAGLEFDFGKVRESNDRDAHRLFKLAEDLHLEMPLRDALHDLYFHEGRVLSDPATLCEAARRANINEEIVLETLDSDAYDREVEEDEMELDALKAESVPFFIIDGEKIDSHLTKEGYMEILKKHLEEKK